MNSSKAIIEDHDLRIKELNSNRTVGRGSIISLETEIANLEANLTFVSTIIKTQGDFLISMNETLIKMGAVNEQSSTSLQADMERQLVQLETEFESQLLKKESNITTNRKGIEDNNININDKVTLLKTMLTSVMGKSENLSSNLANLESKIGTITATLQNNYIGIIDVSDKIRLLNDTVSDNIGLAHNLSSNITNLELEMVTMQTEIQNKYNAIASTVEYMSVLDRSTFDSIRILSNGLTYVTGKVSLFVSPFENRHEPIHLVITLS